MRKTASLLIGVVLVLSTIGIIMLTSTSAVEAATRYHDQYYFVKRQLAALVLGLVALGFGYLIPYPVWKRFAWPIAGIALLALVATLVPGIGVEVKGSRRWIDVGVTTIQPSELGKFAIIVLLARWMAMSRHEAHEFLNGLVKPGLLLGALVLPVAFEPDFGTTILCGVAGLSIMFLGGTRISYLLIGGAGAAVALGLVIMENKNRMGRILAFLDPESYAQKEAYQLIQAKYAFVVGGPYGVGLGESLQKQFYLPEAHTDFIFPIIGEEIGLLASLGISGLFVLFFIAGLRITANAPDDFGRYTAFGITTLLSVQAAFNVAVVTGCLPTKGLPLPFISYGGTSLAVSLGMVGVLANIAHRAAVEKSQRLGVGGEPEGRV
jgi:cell division protein FtsW